jgi:hypothetical protein
VTGSYFQFSEIEKTSFLTVDSVVDKLICTILRVSEHSVPSLPLSHFMYLFHGGWKNVEMLSEQRNMLSEISDDTLQRQI